MLFIFPSVSFLFEKSLIYSQKPTGLSLCLHLLPSAFSKSTFFSVIFTFVQALLVTFTSPLIPFSYSSSFSLKYLCLPLSCEFADSALMFMFLWLRLSISVIFLFDDFSILLFVILIFYLSLSRQNHESLLKFSNQYYLNHYWGILIFFPNKLSFHG